MNYIKNYLDNNWSSTPNCLVCESSFSLSEFKMPCSCYVCKDCFLDWICSQNIENEFSYESKFTCSNHKCNQKFEYEKIINYFNLQEQQRINDILLKKYLNNNPDTRRCPKPNCGYAGWFDFKSDLANCGPNLFCELCSNEWIEESLRKYNCTFFLKNIFKNTKGFVFDDLSEINVKLSSKPCPRCQIQIYKYTGCDHMKCPKCELDYCYNCNKVHQYPDDFKACNMKYTLFSIVIAFFAACLFIKIALAINLVYLILIYYVWFMLINVIYLLYLVFVYFGVIALFFGFWKDCKKHGYGLYISKPFSRVYASVTVTTLILHAYYYFTSDLIEYYSKIMFWEIIIIGSLFILISIIMMLIKKR